MKKVEYNQKMERKMPEVWLPVSLVVLSFFMKLLIDRSTTAPLWITSLYELPIDGLFLGLSFFVAKVIIENTIDPFLLYIFIVVLVAFLCVFIWRRSVRCFEREKFALSIILATLNSIICGGILVWSVRTLAGTT